MNFDAYKKADDIAARWAEPATERTYQIFLPDGEPITCRVLDRYDDLVAWETGLGEFWKTVQNRDTCHPTWLEVLPQSFQEAAAVYTLVFNTVEPTRFSELAAMKLARNPWVMRSLVQQINEAQTRFAQAKEAQTVTEMGKDCAPTHGDEPSSQ